MLNCCCACHYAGAGGTTAETPIKGHIHGTEATLQGNVKEDYSLSLHNFGSRGSQEKKCSGRCASQARVYRRIALDSTFIALLVYLACVVDQPHPVPIRVINGQRS